MSRDETVGPLRIALICPYAWPPRDDLTHHVAAEGDALARRGHAVSVLAPTSSRTAYADGRERIRRLAGGDSDAVLAPPGEVVVMRVARALPARRGRRLVGPFDMSAALEAVLSRVPFDVVHLHEPLAPSPALTALRHAGGIRAVTFHRPDAAAGAAFLRPLVRRVLERVDVRIAAAETTRRAVQAILPGDYALIRPGADPVAFAGAPPVDAAPVRVAIVDRARDRAGIRFALSLIRAERSGIERVSVISAPDASWRTRQAVPRALRDLVDVVPDDANGRVDVLRACHIVAFPAPDELAGPVVSQALARGAALLVARAPELEGLVVHGRNALALPPFAREEWRRALEELVGAPERRRELGARARLGARTWDDAAAELEARYRAARARGRRRVEGEMRIAADLRVRPAQSEDPEAWIAACRATGLRAVAVAATGGLTSALRLANAAPDDLAVIVGQEIPTRDGTIVGLFLSDEVAPGLVLEEALDAIHEQGGVVVAPHPDASAAPSAAALRRVAGGIDCWETLVPDAAQDAAASSALAQRFGALVLAASVARTPAQIGRVWTEIRPFHGPVDFLDALADARLHARPRWTSRDGRTARMRA